MHNALKLPDVTLFRFFFRFQRFHSKLSLAAQLGMPDVAVRHVLKPETTKRSHRNERNETDRNKRNDLRNEQNKKQIRQREYDTKRRKQNHGPAKDRIIFYLRL